MMIKEILASVVVAALLSSCSSNGGGSTGAPSRKVPESKGTVKVNDPRTVTGTLDGGMKTYDGAGLKGGCGQEEDMEPMFNLKDGSALKNMIIKNAPDGIHVRGDNVKIENVWFTDVCEDAITIFPGSDNTIVRNSFFDKSEDKAIQANGGSGSQFYDNYFRDGKSAIRLKKGTGKATGENNVFVNLTGAYVLDKGVSKPDVSGDTYYEVKYPIRQD